MRSASGSLGSIPSPPRSGAPSFAGSKASLSHSKSPEPPAVVEEPVETFLEKAKFYTSLCLGTTAILSVFAFLFLIPFVVDPAISTIIADYDPVPVTCVVTEHLYIEGMKNCSWSSCREGCTSAQTKCHQLYVNYTRIPYEEWQNQPRDLDSIEWDVSYTKYLINSEGCGYPPRVNCTIFAKQHGYNHIGEPFACYYSRAYPEVVIGRYSWEDNLTYLILSLIMPNLLFAVSIGVLSYWYCPCCDRACNKSGRVYDEKFAAKEDKLLCRSDDEDELEY